MTTLAPADISKLKRLLPRLRKVRIAVLGDLMLDRYLWGTASRLSPEAAVPVVDFVSQTNCLGGAGNVAANLAALGARVQAFGVLGGMKIASGKIADDDTGGDFRACLRNTGIGGGGVLPDVHRITTVKTRVIARHQQIVRIDWERNDPLSRDSEKKLLRRLVSTLQSLDAVVLSDYDKGLFSDPFAERVIRACHRRKIPVFVKPKTSRLFAYNRARVVVCNKKEASSYVTRSLNTDQSVEEAGRALLAHFGCAAVVITRGEQGMSVFEESATRALHIKATSFEVTYARVGQPGIERGSSGRQVFDVTGAGDTVLSVLSLAVAAGASLPDAAFLANAAAGVVVGKLGTAGVSTDELAAALDDLQQ
jgi:rfaE bifunctional protein kinase chain/domain